MSLVLPSEERIHLGRRPTLEDNVCIQNAQAGIGYSNLAGGVARADVCVGNRWGIYVAETADPVLTENDRRDNTSEDVLDMRQR